MARPPDPRLPKSIYWTRSEEIYGYPIDYGAIPRIVRHLDARNAIVSLSKACWVLEKWGDTSEEAQRLLAKQFLRGHHLQRAFSLISEPGRVVFFRPQFYLLMKYLARYGWIGDTMRPVGKQELEKLGEALLGVVNLIDAESKRKRRALNVIDRLSGITFELVTTSHVLKYPDISLALARARYMYVNIHRQLAVEPPLDFIDIDNVFQEATGIGLDEYLSIGIGIISHYYKYNTEEVVLHREQDLNIFRPKQYFRKTALEGEVLRRVFDFISMTLSDFRSQASKQSRREMAYDFLIMKQNPLIKLDDDVFVLISYSYLFERFTTGVYWIVFDHLRDNAKNNLHLQFSRYTGVIFQEYVKKVIKHIVERQPERAEKLIFDQPYRVAKREYRTPDVMLFGNDYAVLIESSATRIQAKRTTSLGNVQAFGKDCEKMFFNNAKSLDTFIRNMRDGKVCLEGIDARRIRRFYPVIVTIEGFPKYPVIDAYIDSEIKKRKLLSGDDIAPLSTLGIYDLEALEKWSDVSLIDALRDWHHNPWFPHQAFGDYVISSSGQNRQPVHGSWVESVVHKTFSEAATLMFGRPIPDYD